MSVHSAPLAISFLFTRLAAVAVTRSLARGRSRNGRISADPRCGKCGYIVRGIATLTCPECGSDLREVGIDTGKASAPSWVAIPVLAILWSIALWLVVMMLQENVRQALPQWSILTHNVTLAS